MFNPFASKKKPGNTKKENLRIVDLVERSKEDDEDAFGELYSLYVDSIYRYIYIKIKVSHEAEDLVQQVFLKAWSSIKTFKYEKFPFSSWLYRIAHNQVIDYYRGKKKSNLSIKEEIIVDQSNNPAISQDQKSDKRKLERAIRDLPENQQQVIILKFIEELDNKEIAKIIGKSEGAIRVLQYRALKMLKKILDIRY